MCPRAPGEEPGLPADGNAGPSSWTVVCLTTQGTPAVCLPAPGDPGLPADGSAGPALEAGAPPRSGLQAEGDEARRASARGGSDPSATRPRDGLLSAAAVAAAEGVRSQCTPLAKGADLSNGLWLGFACASLRAAAGAGISCSWGCALSVVCTPLKEGVQVYPVPANGAERCSGRGLGSFLSSSSAWPGLFESDGTSPCVLSFPVFVSSPAVASDAGPGAAVVLGGLTAVPGLSSAREADTHWFQ